MTKHKEPNEETQKAIEELRAGKGKTCATVEELMADLDDYEETVEELWVKLYHKIEATQEPPNYEFDKIIQENIRSLYEHGLFRE